MTVELLSANHGAALAATLAARANRKGRGFCSGVYPSRLDGMHGVPLPAEDRERPRHQGGE